MDHLCAARTESIKGLALQRLGGLRAMSDGAAFADPLDVETMDLGGDCPNSL